MWVVERTAGNVVLKALQNVIGNVKIHHYNMHGCPDLCYARGSLKRATDIKGGAQESYSGTAAVRGKWRNYFCAFSWLEDME